MKEGHPAAASKMKKGHQAIDKVNFLLKLPSRLSEPSCSGFMKEGHPSSASRMKGHPALDSRIEKGSSCSSLKTKRTIL
jgi:hypothetical protein